MMKFDLKIRRKRGKLKECDNVAEEIEWREVTYAIEVVPLRWSATKQEEKQWIN